VAATESYQVWKSWVGAYCHIVSFCQFHGLCHDDRVSSVEAAGYVGGGYGGHYFGVVSDFEVAEAFAEVAVDVNFLLH
jgi:hypothetical protein